jgi:HD domain
MGTIDRRTENVMEILPDTDTARDALEHVRRIELPAIFNHSMRTFILARAAAAATGEEIDLEALFVACLFHDSGTSAENDGPQRFEVEGADAAVRFLHHRGWSPERADSVWEAIALHTSPGIAERRGPIVRYTRLGVRIDFGVVDLLPREFVEATESDYARLDIEQVLRTAVVQQSLSRPEKAPFGSWPGALRSAYLAETNHDGSNPTR